MQNTKQHQRALALRQRKQQRYTFRRNTVRDHLTTKLYKLNADIIRLESIPGTEDTIRRLTSMRNDLRNFLGNKRG